MPIATKTHAKPAHTRARARVAEPGTLDLRQRALEDLDRAREHAL